MLAVKVTCDISKATSLFENLRKDQIPYATQLALNETAKYVAAKLSQAMDTAFDRPTPYTKSAFYIKYARKDLLVASIGIKDTTFKGNPAVRYLFPEISGGARNLKGFEKLLQRSGVMPNGWYAIPASGAPLDAYGNVSGGTINKILSQLQSARDSQANESPAMRTKRNRTRRMGRYFAVMPATEKGKLKPGIYERLGSTFGSAIRLMFIYSSKAPSYSGRYDFYGLAKTIAQERYPIEAGIAMEHAIATAR